MEVRLRYRRGLAGGEGVVEGPALAEAEAGWCVSGRPRNGRFWLNLWLLKCSSCFGRVIEKELMPNKL